MIAEAQPISANQIVHRLDPVQDPRWPEFLAGNCNSSIFHTVDWLRTLQSTYGYEPLVYTTAAPGEALTNGIVFCRVKSWLTGQRQVSLPFSDHCEPLVDGTAELKSLLAPAQAELKEGKIKYIDIRPLSLKFSAGIDNLDSYFIHFLDLRPSAEAIYKSFHGDSIRRKIQRAEREKVTLEVGSSDPLLEAFYDLHVITRQRQQVPPHPLAWFRNVLKCLGDNAQIRVARKDGRAIASILSLAHKQKMVYKYGCSDAHSHNLGGMQFLFWDLIRDAKARGFVELDFGRSECSNAGLVTFKDRWGTERRQMTYLRYPSRATTPNQGSSKLINVGKKVFERCPPSVLRLAGNLLYPHMG
jgi:CelD/BcsL family acetyltransferase involved in cellulose biosynthesis